MDPPAPKLLHCLPLLGRVGRWSLAEANSLI